MHDWTLLDIVFDWKEARVVLQASWKGSRHILVAEGVVELHVPRNLEWGPSIYINGYEGPAEASGGREQLKIEVQSGDVIKIVAKKFTIPSVTTSGPEPFQLPIGGDE